MTNIHKPVLLDEVLACFQDTNLLVDCTLGGAGHTEALLKANPRLKILGCDRDENAIEAAKSRLSEFLKGQNPRLFFFHGNFSTLSEKDTAESLPEAARPPWDGVLMDLGYSSNQLADPRYGMSFSPDIADAPLDMRLDRSSKSETTDSTAWELLHDSSAHELAELFKVYGEIGGSNKIAQRIKEGLQKGEFSNSTHSFATFLTKIAGAHHKPGIHPATLIFQALRIAVNDELRSLDHFLDGVILLMKKGGRIGVITFHSLEDRIVKNWGSKHSASLKPLSKKPILPTDLEVKSNPRARSAKLRVYEITEH